MNFENIEKKLTKRQQQALETRHRLYDSAITLFKEKGYYDVSIDEIVTRAGTSKGSFYTHFVSKDQVIIEYFKNLDNHYIELYQELKNCKSSSEKLINFVKDMYLYVTEKAGFELTYVIYDTQLSQSKEKTSIIDKNRPLYKILYKIMEEGQKSGEFRNDLSINELVRMANHTMRGTFYDWCLYDGNFDIIEDGVKYFSVFIEGIKNREASATRC